MNGAFHRHVLAWLQRERDHLATEVTNVTGDGTDWEGGTEEGFYSRFSVDVQYLRGDVVCTTTIAGDDMESLWSWVVAGWQDGPMSKIAPSFRGPMDPVFPCRVMPTRHCPAVYGAVCGDRPCARFESADETPWQEELRAPVSDDCGKQALDPTAVPADDQLDCVDCYDIAHDELDDRESCDQHSL